MVKTEEIRLSTTVTTFVLWKSQILILTMFLFGENGKISRKAIGIPIAFSKKRKIYLEKRIKFPIKVVFIPLHF